MIFLTKYLFASYNACFGLQDQKQSAFKINNDSFTFKCTEDGSDKHQVLPDQYAP